MADSDSSSLSSLSSVPDMPDSEDEAIALKMSKPTGLDRYFKPAPKKKSATPEPPPRPPSPPHEYTLADNDAIAFLVMFRSRFSDAFPKSLPHLGPQDIEQGIIGDTIGDGVERFLCALLGLVLNRKKDVERGRYNRALEDAIAENRGQWPTAWAGKNPLAGENNFNSMNPEERLVLLRYLVLWSLNQSEVVQALLKESYKQTRRDDDKNQPRSVQPWFSDSHRRRFWLIEGQEDSHFRIYRENDGKIAKSNTWFSVAGTVDELNALADKFTEEGTLNARMNADKLRSAIPRFEAGDEKRRRRDYRQLQKARFSRPEQGFSLYEGRTRGKRAKYTFDDGEDIFDSDAMSTRRSTRNASPSDSGPVVTASGRQVKPRVGGVYGESLSTDQRQEHDYNASMSQADATEDSGDEMPATAPNGRPMRSARAKPTKSAVSSRERYGDGNDDMDTESDEPQSEGQEWSGDENEPDDEESDGDDMADEVSEDELVADEGDMQRSLVVQLRYRPKKTPVPPSSRARTPAMDANVTGKPQGDDTTVDQQHESAPQSQHGLGGSTPMVISPAKPPTPPNMPQPPSAQHQQPPPPQRVYQTYADLNSTHPPLASSFSAAPAAPPSMAPSATTYSQNSYSVAPTTSQLNPLPPTTYPQYPSTSRPAAPIGSTPGETPPTSSLQPQAQMTSYARSTTPTSSVHVPDMSTGVRGASINIEPSNVSNGDVPQQRYQIQPSVMDVS